MKTIIFLILIMTNGFTSAINSIKETNVTTQNYVNNQIVQMKKAPTEKQMQEFKKGEELTSKKTLAFINYFMEYTYTGCNVVDIKCPPLKKQFQKEYYSRLELFDAASGRTECSVLHKNSEEQTEIRQKQTFSNNVCKIEYDKIKVDSLLTENAKKSNELYQKRIALKASLLKKEDGELDIADYLTALITLDEEIFNFKETFATSQIVLQENVKFENLKYTNAKKNLIDYARAGSKYFFNSFSISKYNPMNDPEYRIIANNKYNKYLNAKFIFYIEVMMQYSVIAGQLVFWLILLFFINTAISITNKYLENSADERFSLSFLISKEILLLVIGLALFSNFQFKYSDIHLNEKNRTQTLIQFIYKETNEIADKFNISLYKSWLNNMNVRNGVIDSSSLEAQERNMRILEMQNRKMLSINENCYEIYDTNKIKHILQSIRSKNDRITESMLINELIANPFPKNEKELTLWHQSYNSTGQFGVIKNDKIPNISLVGCYKNKKQILSNEAKIKIYAQNIINFNKDEYREKKATELELINELVAENIKKYGYLSAVSIPTFETFYNMQQISNKKMDSYIKTATEFDVTAMNAGLVKNVFLLGMLPDNLLKVVYESANSIADSTWLSLIPGISIGTNMIATMTILFAADLFSYLLEYLKDSVFYIAASLAFTIMFIEKMVIFIQLPFAIIWAIGTKSLPKMFNVISNVIFISLKPIIILMTIFMTLFGLEMVDLLMGDYTYTYVKIGESFGLFTSIIAYLQNGAYFLLLILVKMALIIWMMFALQRAFADFIEIKVVDLSSGLSHIVQQRLK